jgi:ribosomal peptide maturation radical SAM protein 1
VFEPKDKARSGEFGSDNHSDAAGPQYDVCLLSMPYPVIDQPSVALGLLQSALANQGISAKSFYPCLWFAEEIGLDVFAFIANSKQEFLIGEWTFAGAAFPDFHPDHEAYLDLVLSAAVSKGLSDRSGFRDDPSEALWKARGAAPAFVDKVARRVLKHRPKIVGCTSTFFQHGASLAVLRRIRELDPAVTTVMGGANCEGAMGVATKRCFPWVDFVVSGEADLLFPDLCEKLLMGKRDIAAGDLADGVIGAFNCDSLGNGEDAPRASVFRMDDVPEPDFDDYFETLSASPLRKFISPGLAVETSRGCWWGATKHCTFCGLNGGNMAFRSKSADRVLDELKRLSTKYQVRKFNVVDNILDLKYLRDLLPRLASDDPYTLFFETKVNLKRAQLEVIAAAGIRRLQPGIESMHDDILRLIEKGTTSLQNVQLLKWAREIGIFITWNFLWDVPGEKDEWYGQMAEWLPQIVHMQPPGIDRIQFHRFSPYHKIAHTFGLSLTPYSSYRYVYPLAEADLSGLAYYFDEPARPSARAALASRPNLKRVMQIVRQWNQLWGLAGFAPVNEKPVLLMTRDASSLRINDTRPCAISPSHRLTGLAARVYELCDAFRSIANLDAALAGDPSPPNETELRSVLTELEHRKLLLHHNGRYLALAMRQIRRIPDKREEFPGGFTDVEAWYADARSVAAAHPAP